MEQRNPEQLSEFKTGLQEMETGLGFRMELCLTRNGIAKHIFDSHLRAVLGLTEQKLRMGLTESSERSKVQQDLEQEQKQEQDRRGLQLQCSLGQACAQWSW